MVTAAQFEKLAASMPEATRDAHVGHPDFRVRKKIFAALDGQMRRGTLKLKPAAQDVILAARPDAFESAPGSWGARGWTYVTLSKVKIAELRPLVREAWTNVAPKRLIALHESPARPKAKAKPKPKVDGERQGANPLTISKATLRRLRKICLALPEAAEKEAWGDPTWRVRDKIFAMQKGNAKGLRPSLWMKAPPGAQDVLVSADPERFFVPPYVGHKGWIGVYLDGKKLPWSAIEAHVIDSYRLTAPKKLQAEL